MEKTVSFIVEGDGFSRRRKVLSPGEELHESILALIAEWKKTKPDRSLTYAEACHLAKEEGWKQVAFTEPHANEGKEGPWLKYTIFPNEFPANLLDPSFHILNPVVGWIPIKLA